MAETLGQVKRHFGRDAMILNTRTVSERGVLGRRGRPKFEITAAPACGDLPDVLRSGTLKLRSGSSNSADGAATVLSLESKTASVRQNEALVSEMSALKSAVQQLATEARGARFAGGSDGVSESYRGLVACEVADEIAQQLVESIRRDLTAEQLCDPRQVRRRLARAVAAKVPTAGAIRLSKSGRPRTVALVGPTGVGKTTTIAKLAAHFCLKERGKVGLITVDTYRIAAVEQLRTYANILDIPLEVVVNPRELREAVNRFSDRDVILIDTAGRSQRDTVKNAELRRFFDLTRPDEVHLVLSASCGQAVLIDTIQRFTNLGIDRVIFTKLDEAIGFGVILACLEKAQVELSYVTTGQDVPDDIRVGDGRALAELILSRPGEPNRSGLLVGDDASQGEMMAQGSTVAN